MSKLQKALFLSDKGYKDLKKAVFACTLTNLAMLFPFCVTVMIFSEIRGPIRINQGSVCLKGVVDDKPLCVIFFLKFCQCPEEVQPSQRGLPALETKGAFYLGGLQCFSDNFLQSVQRHHAEGGSAPPFHFIGVKTVAAAHVAQP